MILGRKRHSRKRKEREKRKMTREIRRRLKKKQILKMKIRYLHLIKRVGNIIMRCLKKGVYKRDVIVI